MKEAAKRPQDHKRSLTIAAAVIAVAVGIYLVGCPPTSNMSAFCGAQSLQQSDQSLQTCFMHCHDISVVY